MRGVRTRPRAEQGPPVLLARARARAGCGGGARWRASRRTVLLRPGAGAPGTRGIAGRQESPHKPGHRVRAQPAAGMVDPDGHVRGAVEVDDADHDQGPRWRAPSSGRCKDAPSGACEANVCACTATTCSLRAATTTCTGAPGRTAPGAAARAVRALRACAGAPVARRGLLGCGRRWPTPLHPPSSCFVRAREEAGTERGKVPTRALADEDEALPVHAERLCLRARQPARERPHVRHHVLRSPAIDSELIVHGHDRIAPAQHGQEGPQSLAAVAHDEAAAVEVHERGPRARRQPGVPSCGRRRVHVHVEGRGPALRGVGVGARGCESCTAKPRHLEGPRPAGEVEPGGEGRGEGVGRQGGSSLRVRSAALVSCVGGLASQSSARGACSLEGRTDDDQGGDEQGERRGARRHGAHGPARALRCRLARHPRARRVLLPRVSRGALTCPRRTPTLCEPEHAIARALARLGPAPDHAATDPGDEHSQPARTHERGPCADEPRGHRTLHAAHCTRDEGEVRHYLPKATAAHVAPARASTPCGRPTGRV
mmetsp:Transcript_6168/g.16750  ORF Transcript_6168/g.16750 Transcript_6168/m.16750 type:complete len:543 (+) Transcript_6168:517-2145(+)